MSDPIDRREFLWSAGIAATAATAGCTARTGLFDTERVPTLPSGDDVEFEDPEAEMDLPAS